MTKPNAPAMTVPMIPGIMSTHYQDIGRRSFRKSQMLHQMSQGKVLEVPQVPSSTTVLPEDNANQQPRARPKGQGVVSSKYRVDPTQPSWITNDRQVLRFFGYVQEDVEERGVAATRTRRIVLCYYLSDGTISISEPKTPNSGMVQGELVRKSIVTKPNGTAFSPSDLRIGSNVRLFGRVYHLVDCDEATRAYYAETDAHAPQPSPRKYPDDHGSQLDEIMAIKNKLQAKVASVEASKAEQVRKFQELSQRVLRFYVSWQDPHPLYPETRRYVLHYFLCDDTIEVVEPRDERSGRGHFPVLLSRRKMKNELARGRAIASASATGATDANTTPERWLTDRDLRCGEWIQLFSRKFLLEDCDAFTRDYYLQTHGVTQEKFSTPKPKSKAVASKWKLFQAKSPKASAPNAPGDNLRRVVHDAQGHTEQAKHFHASDALDKKLLRFRAKFHGLPPDDVNAHRRFIVTYYLEDDTLAIFEPPVKNSGIIGGRFLDRGRFRRVQHARHGGTHARETQKERSCYTASDFYVGAVVGFEFSPNQRLELIEADKQTLSYCEAHPDEFIYSDGERVLQQLARWIVSTSSMGSNQLRQECRRVDRQGCGFLQLDELKDVLVRVGVFGQLNAQQLITLTRMFEVDTESDERLFWYDDWVDVLSARVWRIGSAYGDKADMAGQPSWIVALRKIPRLRKVLRAGENPSRGNQNSHHVSMGMFSKAIDYFKAKLETQELSTIKNQFGDGADAIDYYALCDAVFEMPPPAQSSSKQEADTDNPMVSARSFQIDDDDGDMELPPSPKDGSPRADNNNSPRVFSSPRKLPANPSPRFDHSPRVEFSPRVDYAPRVDYSPRVENASPRLASPRKQLMPALQLPEPTDLSVAKRGDSTPRTDSRVLALLHRVFGSRKYQLRKALRERDRHKTGILTEEDFMAAVLEVEPKLSDDDTYLIADVYFPNNNSTVDYAKMLEHAFRT
ncbi:TPA: hypothetical protein N0F65_002863 [Lagenidium giganteum]|uniref:DM10 domain-containing protein n=1 Tax=Lagenidium giganteum TaxID=4803 RepID=A0AAV2ZGF1_9STRA|nr:TPA: hypothetical protein N0F65_002863 [Lagenidium giganteum]